jgi:hypothetical protein
MQDENGCKYKVPMSMDQVMDGLIDKNSLRILHQAHIIRGLSVPDIQYLVVSRIVHNIISHNAVEPPLAVHP